MTERELNRFICTFKQYLEDDIATLMEVYCGNRFDPEQQKWMRYIQEDYLILQALEACRDGKFEITPEEHKLLEEV